LLESKQGLGRLRSTGLKSGKVIPENSSYKREKKKVDDVEAPAEEKKEKK